ncbi:hypothetical protein Fmac_028323 [Flemingia macrophylla]|uniref:Uncharacterized protein n=1 Tax=Flemingia macrophylla TaxID=520843 RepID=A0ABD1L767_9FABA
MPHHKEARIPRKPSYHYDHLDDEDRKHKEYAKWLAIANNPLYDEDEKDRAYAKWPNGGLRFNGFEATPLAKIRPSVRCRCSVLVTTPLATSLASLLFLSFISSVPNAEKSARIPEHLHPTPPWDAGKR